MTPYQNLSVPNILKSCRLFSNLTPAEIEEIARVTGSDIRRYEQDNIVAFEEDECGAIGIVIYGSIHIQRIYASGKQITIETFRTGDSFGEALVFSDTAAFPATLLAKEACAVYYIPRETVARLCQLYPRFMDTFLRTLSNRILLLNRKIKSISYNSVRQKVAHCLLVKCREQASDRLVLDCTRAELADALGIPRPSLSRELIAMREAGWIDFERNTITIRDRPSLEAILTA